MRLVDADALIKDINARISVYDRNFEYGAVSGLVDALECVKEAQTVDATEVIRCKYCKHYNAGFECLKEGYGIEYPQDYFCGSAERRQDVQNKN